MIKIRVFDKISNRGHRIDINNIYNLNKEKPYTIRRAFSLITPYFLLIALTWILLVVGWYIIGLPIGPNVFPTI